MELNEYMDITNNTRLVISFAFASIIIASLLMLPVARATQDIACDNIFTDNFELLNNGPGNCPTLSIEPMGLHSISHGATFSFQPAITGEINICRKDLGHDDVKVDSETGLITWDTSSLLFGRGFHIRIKCSNYQSSSYASMVIHVDKSGSSQLRVAGVDGVSQYIRDAASSMNGGDTIVFPDGIYPVSVTADASYENALKQSNNVPTDGNADQLSTIISQTPGGVIITGAPHNGIPKQKNALQLSSSNYIAIVGFVIRDVLRESFTASNGNRMLVEFVGTAGAGTNNQPCSNFAEAGNGWCSKAGMRANQGTPLFQSNYNWGHNRYGIMTRSTTGSITRRSFVRLDEHKGDQPYGGFSDYCDTAHLSQDNTIFDSLAIAAPHYKNYAGLTAFPATGCENTPSDLSVSGFLAVNNDLSLSLLDSKAGVDHEWDSIVSYDSQATCAPQTNNCALALLQSDKPMNLQNSFFGEAAGFAGNTSTQAFSNNINMLGNVVLQAVNQEADQGVPPRYLPESLLYFRGKSDTFFGEPAYNTIGTARRWPIGGEDIIAANMRSYRNQAAFKVGGGTVDIDGNRGATAAGESISEYLWAYIDPLIPPLVVRVKNKSSYHRIAWEHLSSTRRAAVTAWKIICVSSGNSLLASLPETQLRYQHSLNNCSRYGVKAVYADGESGIAYAEQVEGL